MDICEIHLKETKERKSNYLIEYTIELCVIKYDRVIVRGNIRGEGEGGVECRKRGTYHGNLE